jgi:microcystin-dependent protein
MSQPYLGEIKMFGGNFAPKGYAMCNGQILAITQNTALFSLLGTNFGGNGTSNFGLPNLQGTFPVGAGQGNGLSPRVIGETGGESAVTLQSTQMPIHTHAAQCVSAGGNADDPTRAEWAIPHAGKSPIAAYTASTASNTPMNSAALPFVGGNLPHDNMPPYVVVNFIIALQGVFPARN